jgi:ATP-binding cassette subfamily F protein 3
MLTGLGFEREDFTNQTSEFRRMENAYRLAKKSFCKSPDLILLDEPTNPHGYRKYWWLEEFLMNEQVVVISHDRAVDNITNRTIEVTSGRIYDYKAKYSLFRTT